MAIFATLLPRLRTKSEDSVLDAVFRLRFARPRAVRSQRGALRAIPIGQTRTVGDGQLSLLSLVEHEGGFQLTFSSDWGQASLHRVFHEIVLAGFSGVDALNRRYGIKVTAATWHGDLLWFTASCNAPLKNAPALHVFANHPPLSGHISFEIGLLP